MPRLIEVVEVLYRTVDQDHTEALGVVGILLDNRAFVLIAQYADKQTKRLVRRIFYRLHISRLDDIVQTVLRPVYNATLRLDVFGNHKLITNTKFQERLEIPCLLGASTSSFVVAIICCYLKHRLATITLGPIVKGVGKIIRRVKLYSIFKAGYLERRETDLRRSK